MSEIQTHVKPRRTWETISNHHDRDRFMRRAFILDQRQIVVNDLLKLCTSWGVLAWESVMITSACVHMTAHTFGRDSVEQGLHLYL